MVGGVAGEDELALADEVDCAFGVEELVVGVDLVAVGDAGEVGVAEEVVESLPRNVLQVVAVPQELDLFLHALHTVTTAHICRIHTQAEVSLLHRLPVDMTHQPIAEDPRLRRLQLQQDSAWGEL